MEDQNLLISDIFQQRGTQNNLNKSRSIGRIAHCSSQRKIRTREIDRSSMTLQYIFLILLIITQIFNVSAFSMSSPYLGAAKKAANEHLLLFKLPPSISSRIQLHLSQPDSLSKRNAYVSAQPELQEQTISLTIPLSKLQAPINFIGEQGARLKQQTVAEQTLQIVSPYESQSNLAQSTRSYHMNSISNLDPVDFDDHQDTSGHSYTKQPDYVQVEAHRPPEQSRYIRASSQQHTQEPSYLDQKQHHHYSIAENYTDDADSIEQQLKQLIQLYLEHYPTSSANLIPSHQTLASSSQQLWHDQLQANYNQASGSYKQPPMSDSSSSYQARQEGQLLSKLAGSSPDLLLRLKRLLQKSSQFKQLSDSNATSTQYPYGSGHPDPVGYQNETKYGAIEGLQSYIREPAYSNNQSLLNAFLTTHNISSHEEVKLPFVVIAMPRIVSLKRNHGTNVQSPDLNQLYPQERNQYDQKANSSSHQTSLRSIQSLLEQALLSARSRNAARAVSYDTLNTTSDHSYANSTAAQLALNRTFLHEPYGVQPISSNYSDYLISGSRSKQLPETTAIPYAYHTMAPYTQHFNPSNLNHHQRSAIQVYPSQANAHYQTASNETSSYDHETRRQRRLARLLTNFTNRSSLQYEAAPAALPQSEQLRFHWVESGTPEAASNMDAGFDQPQNVQQQLILAHPHHQRKLTRRVVHRYSPIRAAYRAPELRVEQEHTANQRFNYSQQSIRDAELRPSSGSIGSTPIEQQQMDFAGSRLLPIYATLNEAKSVPTQSDVTQGDLIASSSSRLSHLPEEQLLQLMASDQRQSYVENGIRRAIENKSGGASTSSSSQVANPSSSALKTNEKETKMVLMIV